MKENYLKLLITAVVGFFTSIFGVLAIPVLLMVTCSFIDYATGIIAAKYRNLEIDSYKGIAGIVKKVCIWLLVGVGGIIDELLLYSSETIGFTIPFTFLIAGVVAIWIVCNELISILENLKDIGVPMPSFLMPLVNQLKSQVDKSAESEVE